MSMFDTLWEAPMSNRGTLIVRTPRDRPIEVELLGETTGRLTLLSLARTAGIGPVIVVHEAGHHYFAGRGDRNYAGATVRTFAIAAVGMPGPDGRAFRYIELSSAPHSPRDRADLTATIAARMFELEMVLS